MRTHEAVQKRVEMGRDMTPEDSKKYIEAIKKGDILMSRTKKLHRVLNVKEKTFESRENDGNS